MFYHWLLRLFALIGISAAIAAGYCFFFLDRSEGGSFAVEEPKRILGELTVERDYDVDFRIVNRTGRNLRVLGSALT